MSDGDSSNGTFYRNPKDCPPISRALYERLYHLLRPFRYVKSSSEGVVSAGLRKKVELAEITNEGYLFSESRPFSKDDLDFEFEADVASSKADVRSCYGLHSYGGYYGFFRPDLDEIIRLAVLEGFHGDELDGIDRIYVTTKPHPGDDIREAYDRERDLHRGKTDFYVVRKRDVPPPIPQ